MDSEYDDLTYYDKDNAGHNLEWAEANIGSIVSCSFESTEAQEVDEVDEVGADISEADAEAEAARVEAEADAARAEAEPVDTQSFLDKGESSES